MRTICLQFMFKEETATVAKIHFSLMLLAYRECVTVLLFLLLTLTD